MPGCQRAFATSQQAGRSRMYAVAVATIAVTDWLNVPDLQVGQDFGACLFGEPEVVLVERILGPDTAANHASDHYGSRAGS